MKTLDEVIDDFEKACDLERRCVGCSGCLGQEYGCPNDGAESVPDALHYLKEYRKLDSLDAVAFPEDDNQPLTWDELKQMEGKPVWVEYGTFSDSGWALISEIREQGCIEFLLPFGLSLVMQKGAIGKTWQAYRKKPYRKKRV